MRKRGKRDSKPELPAPLCVTLHKGDGEPEEGYVVRMSLCGANVVATRGADVGDEILLRQDVGLWVVTLPGRVEWRRGLLLGIRFNHALGARETHAVVEAKKRVA